MRAFLAGFVFLAVLIGFPDFPTAQAADPKGAKRDLVFEEGPETGGRRDLVHEDDEPAPSGRSYSAEELDALSDEAEALFEAGRYAEAIPLLEEFIPAAAALAGAEHPAVGTARLYLGFSYYDQEQYPQAAKNLAQALEGLGGPEGLPQKWTQGPLCLAEAQTKSGDPDGALETMSAYLPAIGRRLGPNHEQVTLGFTRLAEAFTFKGETGEAVEAYKLVYDRWVKARGKADGESVDAALELAKAYQRAGEPAQALALFRDLEKTLSRGKGANPQYLAVVKSRLAGFYSNTGQYAKALAAREEALALAIKLGGQTSPSAIQELSNLASAYTDLDQWAQALEIQKTVWAAFTKSAGPEDPMTILAASNLAGGYRAMNCYGTSLDLAERTVQTALSALGEGHERTIQARLTLANTLSLIGDYGAALAAYEETLAAAEKYLPRDHQWTLSALEGMAAVYGNRARGENPADNAKTQELMKRVWESRVRSLGADHPDTLVTEMNLIRGLAKQKQFAQAKEALGPLLPKLAQAFGEEHKDYLAALEDLGELLSDLGQPAQAVEVLEPLLAQVKANGDANLYLGVSRNLSRALKDQGDLEAAAFFARQSVAAGQSLRKKTASASPEAQKALAAALTPAYQALADLLMAQGKVAEAQEVMGLLKQFELADLTAQAGGAGQGVCAPVAETSAAAAPKAKPAAAAPKAKPAQAAQEAAGEMEGSDILAGVDPEIARRYQEISDQLAALGEEQRVLLDKKSSGETLSAKEEERLKTLRQDMTAARKVFSSFVSNLSAELSKGGDKRTADLGNLETYQRLLSSLGEGVVLLQTIVTDSRIWLILTTPNALIARESPFDVRRLAEKVSQFRDALQDPEADARPLAKEFYDGLIGPVAEALQQAKARTIMFSLDGQLRYIPMVTLFDGKKWLAQDYTVTLFNDAAKAGLATPPVGNWRVAALGVTKGHTVSVGGKRGNFSALPAVKSELAAIVKPQGGGGGVLPGTMTLDEGFTSEALAEALETGYPVVHLASHFHFDPKNPEQSFLLLGDGSGLPLTRIETEDFKFKSVDLLALSACQTARGGTDATGKEIEGFGALAQKRGAKAVLATLWPVFDESTGLLMSSFYRLRADEGRKLSIAESLRQAQLLMINNQVAGQDYQHPFYWGPFVLMGDWR